jgi:hypothetical protein
VTAFTPGCGEDAMLKVPCFRLLPPLILHFEFIGVLAFLLHTRGGGDHSRIACGGVHW